MWLKTQDCNTFTRPYCAASGCPAHVGARPQGGQAACSGCDLSCRSIQAGGIFLIPRFSPPKESYKRSAQTSLTSPAFWQKFMRAFVTCKSSMSKESFAEILCKKAIHQYLWWWIATGYWHLSLLCMLQWGFTPFSLRREVFKQRGGEVLWDLYHWWTCWQWNHPTGRSSFFGFADVFKDWLYSLVPKFSPTAPTVQLWHLEHGSHGELLPSFLAPMIDRKGLPFWELF